MKILIIKISSLGDIIHTFPALFDAKQALPDAQFDWLAEDQYMQLLGMNPHINQALPMRWRKWRHEIIKNIINGTFKDFYQQLSAQSYDIIIDAHGQMKTALLSRLARGVKCGYDQASLVESFVSWGYQRCFSVDKNLSAVTRSRLLFSQALGYSMPDTRANFGLDLKHFSGEKEEPNIVLFHGTTWESKHWPEEYWHQLVRIIHTSGRYKIKLGWGSAEEFERSQRIAQGLDRVEILPRLNIPEMAEVITRASLVVAVDTGFAHLADALDTPLLMLFGSTNPNLVGPQSEKGYFMAGDFPCAPCNKRQCYYPGPTPVKPACFAAMTPASVWEKCLQLI